MLAPDGIPNTVPARVMLYAIGLQESKLTHRYQIIAGGGKGPARGLWQFEKNGGVKGVLNYKTTAEIARRFAAERAASIDPLLVWEALEHDDILACIFARLLLWTESKPLPLARLDEQPFAWNCYNRNWRPGKPHPKTWPGNWLSAIKAIKESKC
jgi:hypothetical protein